jgi:hypothetical protein
LIFPRPAAFRSGVGPALPEAGGAAECADDLEGERAVGAEVWVGDGDVLPWWRVADGIAVGAGRQFTACSPVYFDVAAALAGLMVVPRVRRWLDRLAALAAEADVIAAAEDLVLRPP